MRCLQRCFTLLVIAALSSCGSGGGSPSSVSTPAPPDNFGVSPASMSNGVIGAPFNQTIQATGGVAPFTWKVSSGALPHNLSLDPSTTNTVTISGTPDTVQQQVTFTIEVTDSNHTTASQPYTISILLQADSLVLSPASLDFGNQVLGGTSSALTETLTNTATTAMVISGTAISTNQASNAGEFTQSSTTCGTALAAGASCTIDVTFSPGQAGPRAAALTITDDTAGSPQSVALGGVGLSGAPNATLSATSVTFDGTELVDTTSPARGLSLTNYGTATLNIASLSTTSSFYETDTCVGSLASGATCNISVTFKPDSAGNVGGTLSISDDAAGAPQNVTLSGTGSTYTPPLTGLCLLHCFPGEGPPNAPDPVHCPVGQPSDNPVSGSCGLGDVTIDEARRCTVKNGFHTYSGVCEASQ